MVGGQKVGGQMTGGKRLEGKSPVTIISIPIHQGSDGFHHIDF